MTATTSGNAMFAIRQTSEASPQTPANQLPFWRRLLLFVGFVAIAVTIFFLGLMFFTGCAASPGWQAKNSSSESAMVIGPILKVGGKDASYTSLKKAILAATPGTHVQVQGSVLEELVDLEAGGRTAMDWNPPVIVEPAGESPVTWTPPGNAPTDEPLLDVQGVRGLEFHNFILDGQDRQQIGVQLVARCPGVVLEKLQFRGFTKRELQMRNAAGYPDQPIKLLDLSVVVSEPRASGALQFSYSKDYPQVLRSEHYVVHGCRFEGPFKSSPLDKNGNFADMDWQDNVWVNSGNQSEVPAPK